MSYFSGCSVLVGNIKPVDEKSQSYGLLDLSKTNSDWIKLDPVKSENDAHSPSANASDRPSNLDSTDIPDVAYQSKKTSSIISLDSACRNDPENPDQDLKTLTNLLLLGMTDVTLRQEQPLVLMNNCPALETTVEGKLANDSEGKRMALRTIVLKRGHCDYDFVYMARPENFNQQEADFSQFVASLRVK